MADTLKDSHFNWFEFICQMESKNNACTKGMLNSFHSCLSKFDFTERELVLTDNLTWPTKQMRSSIHTPETKWKGFLMGMLLQTVNQTMT